MNSKVGKPDFFSIREGGDFHHSSGRTLTIGLRIIAQCLQDYNTWFTVNDHHPSGNKVLLTTVFNIVDELDLKGFYYRQSDNTIMFDLKQEYPQNERIPNLIRLGN